MNRLTRRLCVVLVAVTSTFAAVLPASAAPPRIGYSAEGRQPLQSDLFFANLDGSGPFEVTATAASEEDMDVSPDGTRIVYVRDRSLYVANVDGSAPQRLSATEECCAGPFANPQFSADGAQIGYTDGSDGRIHIIDRDDRDDRNDRTVGPEDARFMSWSPDGTRIAFTTFDDTDIRRAPRGVLQTMTVDGRDIQTLHSREFRVIEDAKWSPTGTHIALSEDDSGSAHPNSPPTELRILRVADRSSIVVDGADVGSGLDWSDDGSTIVFDQYVPEEDAAGAFTVRRDGTHLQRILPGFDGVRDPVYVGNAPGTIPAQAAFDGDATTTERLDATSPTAAAVAASRRLWSDQNGAVAEEARQPALPRATYAVLSRDDTFADSLAGAALTFRGPLLYTETEQLPPETRSELDRVLGPGGLVYVLGGDRAVSPAVVATLQADGYTVRRLAGPSRVETAIAVADEVRTQLPNYRRVLLARADGPGTAAWADSVTGGAFAADARIPLLLTPTDQLHPAVKAWMDRDQPSQTLLLGGLSALTRRVEQAVPAPLRVAGAARDETATSVARTLWKVEPTGTRRYTIIDGYATDGWAWGLAAAGLADRADAPLLMVHPNTVPSATATAVSGCRQIDLLVVGDTRSVSEARVRDLQTRDERC